MAVQPDNHTIWNLTREQWFQAVCFSLCFLAFMLAESAVNARAADLLGPGRVNAVYALGLVCTGPGRQIFLARGGSTPFTPWAWSAPAWDSCPFPYCANWSGGSRGGNTPPSLRGRYAWPPPSCSSPPIRPRCFPWAPRCACSPAATSAAASTIITP